MRTILLVVAAALLLAGCEHMYGAGDIRLSDGRLVQMAQEEAARRNISLRGLAPSVARFDTGASIYFESPGCRAQSCIDGGLPHFFVPAGQRRITYVRTSY